MHENMVSSLTEMEKQDLKTVDEDTFELYYVSNKFTSDGRLLVPQPSSDPADPLNWSGFWKNLILFQVSTASLVGFIGSSAIVPGIGTIAKVFHTTTNVMSYQASAYVFGNMFGTLLWTPISNAYGRRPVYLLAGLMSFAANLGGGFAATYAGLFISRVIQGFGSAAFNVVTGATIADLFFLHERGAKTGVWTYMTISGSTLGMIIGGVVIQAAGFRWAIQLTTILKGVLLIASIFLLPETLYPRHPSGQIKKSESSHTSRPIVHQKERSPIYSNLTRVPFKQRIGSPVKLKAILEPFKMLKHPNVFLLCLFLNFGYAFGNKGLAILVPQVYPILYGFDTRQQGLTFISFLVGGIIGEAFAGWLSDYIIYRRTKVDNDSFEPEMRLTALPLGILSTSVGLLLWGIFVDIGTPWISPVMAGGMVHCGIQINTTLAMAYFLDCYGPTQKTASAVMLIWFFKNLFETITPFFDLVVSKKLGFTKWFTIQFSIVLGTGLACTLLLWPSIGKRLRNWSEHSESKSEKKGNENEDDTNK